MAERQGFEPWVPLRVQRFSKPSRSTTPAPLRALFLHDLRSFAQGRRICWLQNWLQIPSQFQTPDLTPDHVVRDLGIALSGHDRRVPEQTSYPACESDVKTSDRSPPGTRRPTRLRNSCRSDSGSGTQRSFPVLVCATSNTLPSTCTAFARALSPHRRPVPIPSRTMKPQGSGKPASSSTSSSKSRAGARSWILGSSLRGHGVRSMKRDSASQWKKQRASDKSGVIAAGPSSS